MDSTDGVAPDASRATPARFAGRGCRAMARKTMQFFAFAVLLLCLGLALVGCGPKPPCEGATVTQVQSAQDECAAATDQLNSARDDRAKLEADVASTKSEISQLEGKPADLADQLEELKKGSGR